METTKARFRLRPPTDADVPALVVLGRLETERQGVSASLTEDEVRAEWRTPGVDRERHYRVAEAGGRVVARAAMGLSDVEEYGFSFGAGYVDPDHRGLGIGAALLDWMVDTAAEAGAKELYTRVPAERDAEALAESRGFRYARTFYRMVNADPAAAPRPQWPEGFCLERSLRGEALVEALAQMHDRSFVDHWNFRRANRDRVRYWLTLPGVEPDLAFFARSSEGELAGYVWSYTDFGAGIPRGGVAQIGTARPFRRLGIGKALLRHGVRALAERGATEVVLHVDSENPTGALELYKGSGFVASVRQRTYRLALSAPRG